MIHGADKLLLVLAFFHRRLDLPILIVNWGSFAISVYPTSLLLPPLNLKFLSLKHEGLGQHQLLLAANDSAFSHERVFTPIPSKFSSERMFQSTIAAAAAADRRQANERKGRWLSKAVGSCTPNPLLRPGYTVRHRDRPRDR